MKKVIFFLGLFILHAQGMDFKENKTISIATYNVTAYCFDKKEPQYQNHLWANRRPAVFHTIEQKKPDILGVQELMPDQALEFSTLAGYQSFFLSQTPSEIEAGIIAEGTAVKEWCGKDTGATHIGILFKKSLFSLKQTGRFWLKEYPDTLPIYIDRKETDKGFGNMNTYRAVMWVELLHLPSKQEVFIFNSHYPLSGNHETRYQCAKTERAKISQIAQEKFWISIGDRNIIPAKEEPAEKSDMKAMEPLIQQAFLGFNPENHMGPLATWAGFTYDAFKNPLVNGCFKWPKLLDVIVSNYPPIRSEHIITQFDPKTKEIQLNPEYIKEERCFATDHLMVLVNYNIPSV